MEDNQKMKIVGLVGSLRKDSFNKAIMREAVKSSPEYAEIEIVEIDFPLFNQDLENDMPEVVKNFKQKIEAADAVLIASPEYNYSVPGVLKNAIDWGSRPYGQSCFEGKPVGIMSAGVGMLGGARAQYHLRQSFVFLNMHPLNRPEVMVPNAADKIENGEVKDAETKEKISELVKALVAKAKESKTSKS